jgi:hypothetical protein
VKLGNLNLLKHEKSKTFVNFQKADKANPSSTTYYLIQLFVIFGMGTSDMIKQIKLQEEAKKKERSRIAAEKLYDDYVNDVELTIFTTALASEPFITDYAETA